MNCPVCVDTLDLVSKGLNGNSDMLNFCFEGSMNLIF